MIIANLGSFLRSLSLLALAQDGKEDNEIEPIAVNDVELEGRTFELEFTITFTGCYTIEGEAHGYSLTTHTLCWVRCLDA